MIRLAEDADIPRIVAMGERFHALAGHDIPYDREAVADFLRATMANPDAAVICHDHGMIGGVLVPLYYNPAAVMAVETFWWAERDGRSLLAAFEGWAHGRGAKRVVVSRLEGKGDRALDALFRRRGYAPMEHSYVRAI